ncbi:MAG: heparinase II/III family protein [Vulcanimicrobiota bacterium]
MIDWERSYRDIEDAYSLHRFGWLLPVLLEANSMGVDRSSAAAFVKRVIDSWNQHHQDAQPGHYTWQAYTISERLVNWIIAYYSCVEDAVERPFFYDSAKLQARYLCDILEYHGPFTGNHLSNNGRALYITGLILADRDLVRLGKSILLNERSRLFGKSGFLNEGSSHYQFLVSMNYCEAIWFAQKFNDAHMVQELHDTVSSLTEACAFFLVNNKEMQWDIPLIGDISPDCRVDWLIGVPWVGAQLTGNESPEIAPPRTGLHQFLFDNSKDTKGYSGSTDYLVVREEWAKIKKDGWLVYTHINSRGYPFAHAHQDTGSLCAYYDSVPVLIDCGRVHYLDDDEGRRGCDFFAHSMAVIDNLNPSPYYRRFYPDSFLKSITGLLPYYSVKDGCLEIYHGGFARSKGVDNYYRRVSCNESQLFITDYFAGRNRHQVSIIFHIPFHVSEDSNGFSFQIEEKGQIIEMLPPAGLNDRSVHYGMSKEISYGWGSRNYGHVFNLSTVVLSGKVKLPWESTTVFKTKK